MEEEEEKINFICSSQPVIFFLLNRYKCFEKEKNRRKTRKNRGITSAISSLVMIWKLCYSYPGYNFIWNLRVAYFTVKHSYLCNNLRLSFQLRPTVFMLWLSEKMFLAYRTSGMDSISSLSAVYARGPKKYTLNVNDVCLWRNYLVFACCTYPCSPPNQTDSPEQDGGWVK